MPNRNAGGKLSARKDARLGVGAGGRLSASSGSTIVASKNMGQGKTKLCWRCSSFWNLKQMQSNPALTDPLQRNRCNRCKICKFMIPSTSFLLFLTFVSNNIIPHITDNLVGPLKSVRAGDNCMVGTRQPNVPFYYLHNWRSIFSCGHATL